MRPRLWRSFSLQPRAAAMTIAPARRRPARRTPWRRLKLAVEAAEAEVSNAEGALAGEGEQFCSDAEDYVEALDRYGKLFTDDVATVGDVNTAGADLVEPRESVAASVEATKWRGMRWPRLSRN